MQRDPLPAIARAARYIFFLAGFAIAGAACGDRTALLTNEFASTDGGVEGADGSVALSTHPCPYTSGFQAGAPWPMVGHCADHQDMASVTGPSAPSLSWSAEIDSSIGSPIIAAGGIIYLCNGDNFTTVADDGTGTMEGITYTATCSGAALSYDGALYVTFTDGTLSSFDSFLNQQWQATLASATQPAPPVIGPDGTIYVSTYQSLFAVSSAGKQIFEATYPINSESNAAAAVASDGTIYVALSGQPNLAAFDSAGNQKWTFDIRKIDTRYFIGADVDGSPTIGSDGTIYISTGQENSFSTVFAIDPSGNLKWTGDFAVGNTGDISEAAPAIAPDGSIVFVNLMGQVGAFAPDGTPKWNLDLQDDSSFGSPAIDANGTIYVGTFRNAVVAIDSSGKRKWTQALGGQASSPAIDANGAVIVASTDGLIQAIGP